MKLKYVGHIPVVSSRDTDSCIGKEDNYVYIEAATKILNFLDKLDMQMESAIDPQKVLEEDDIFDVLHKHRPNFEIYYNNLIAEYEKRLDDEVLTIEKKKSLGEIEKEVFKNNLHCIKEYRLQRATNKLVYDELVKGCIDLIQKKGVDEIIMPMSQSFVHVAETFQSTLSLINRNAIAEVEVMLLNHEQPYTRLSIGKIGNV